MADSTYTGSCKCGALEISLQGEPAYIGLCHCLNCRKTTGSSYSTNAVFPKPAFTSTTASGEPKVFEVVGASGNAAFTHSCGICSSTLWTTSAVMTEIVVVKAGCLDGEGVLERLVPQGEVFTKRRPGWVGCVEGAGQFEGAFEAGKVVE